MSFNSIGTGNHQRASINVHSRKVVGRLYSTVSQLIYGEVYEKGETKLTRPIEIGMHLIEYTSRHNSLCCGQKLISPCVDVAVKHPLLQQQFSATLSRVSYKHLKQTSLVCVGVPCHVFREEISDVSFYRVILGDVEDMKTLLLQVQQENAKVNNKFVNQSDMVRNV